MFLFARLQQEVKITTSRPDAQWVKALAAVSDDLGLIPGTQIAEGENLKAVLRLPHYYCGVQMPVHMHKEIRR